MLERILKLYIMYMMGDVRSPVPHLFGPPGCGKSTSVEQAAMLVKKKLHIINVARLSPLELEGVQMPVTMDTQDMHLKLLTATFWTQLREGDILLLDEFLRGFPDVYNGLLDILTSRQVGGFHLPKVFIIAASNSTVSYDKALEDRLLHIPVTDPRNNKAEKRRLAQLLAEQIGLLPDMVSSMEMEGVLNTEVLPMFDILDQMGNVHASSPSVLKGSSIRNLIGQAGLREIQSGSLRELLDMNNARCRSQNKYQYLVLPDGNVRDSRDVEQTRKLHDDKKIQAKLTERQRLNIEINLQLVEMEAARKEGTEVHDDVSDDDIFN